MTITTRAELCEAVNDGTLTIVDWPDFIEPHFMVLVHRANGGDMNAAIALVDELMPAWSWRVGYDNRAVLTWREDEAVSITTISLSPAHAILLAVVQFLARGVDATTRG